MKDANPGAWSLAEGDELGGYRVLRPIGRGGMGEVYLVENVGMGKQYAMKLLPPELSEDGTFRERFKREARVMAELDHVGIVRVNHMAEEGGRFFLVMDYVRGPGDGPRTLAAEFDEKGKLPENEARRISLELSEALAYAHGKGVVHRDIKPANVLLDREGRAKLSDFGLARLVGEEFIQKLTQKSISVSLARTAAPGDPRHGAPSLTESENALIGTYEYMSPEQQAGKPADERSDIYSLGLVIYRMLTGRPAKGRFPLPSELGFAGWWDGILEKALASEPADRQPSVAEIVGSIKRPRAPGRGMPKVAVGIAAAVLLLGALVVVGLLARSDPPRPAGDASTRDEKRKAGEAARRKAEEEKHQALAEKTRLVIRFYTNLRYAYPDWSHGIAIDGVSLALRPKGSWPSRTWWTLYDEPITPGSHSLQWSGRYNDDDDRAHWTPFSFAPVRFTVKPGRTVTVEPKYLGGVFGDAWKMNVDGKPQKLRVEQ